MIGKNDIDKLKEDYDKVEVPSEIDFRLHQAIKRGKRHNRFKVLLNSGMAACAALFLVFFSLAGYGKLTAILNHNEKNTTAPEIKGKALPTLGSQEKLMALLKDFKQDHQAKGAYDGAPMNTGSVPQNAEKSAVKTENSSSETKNYSSTNVQVEGVDEDDVVKTDGEYIYKLNNNKIVIVKASPESMQVASSIDIPKDYNVRGLYLYGKYLISMGEMFSKNDVTTKAVMYDISNKGNISKVRELEVSGSYVSSRMTGGRLYVVANKNINMSLLEDGSDIKPYYIDSVVNTKPITVNYDSIKYMPEAVEPNFINMASLNLNNIDEKVVVESFLGSGRSIYASDKNIYVAGVKLKESAAGKVYTEIYKFELDAAGVKLAGQGEVPGTVLNQFSMDEADGYFRIATNEGGGVLYMQRDLKAPANSGGGLRNNLYVLDGNMNIKGKIEGIAPGERIYSVRFMGDRAYMVTFKLMDPFFVIDLKNPDTPKILGELKIPGFSNYLQPYDENHILGLGYDTRLVEEGGTERAQTLGMKLALFDVSDVKNPVQQFTVSIGGRGTSSEALNNHKALLFSKEKGIIAFPVTEMSYDEKTGALNNFFQGAYVYNLDLNNGFTLKGKITHTDASDSSGGVMQQKKIMQSGYSINRIIYIDNTLYTLSNACIKANNMESLKETSRIYIK